MSVTSSSVRGSPSQTAVARISTVLLAFVYIVSTGWLALVTIGIIGQISLFEIPTGFLFPLPADPLFLGEEFGDFFSTDFDERSAFPMLDFIDFNPG